MCFEAQKAFWMPFFKICILVEKTFFWKFRPKFLHLSRNFCILGVKTHFRPFFPKFSIFWENLEHFSYLGHFSWAKTRWVTLVERKLKNFKIPLPPLPIDQPACSEKKILVEISETSSFLRRSSKKKKFLRRSSKKNNFCEDLRKNQISAKIFEENAVSSKIFEENSFLRRSSKKSVDPWCQF